MKSLLLSVMLLGMVGCQEQSLWQSDAEKAEKRQNFQELVERGRRAEYVAAENVEGIALSGFALTGLTQSSQGEAVWQGFDTRQMLDVEAGDLVSYARRWVAQQENQLGLSDAELIADEQSKLRINDQLMSIHFKRQKEGALVKDAYIEFIFAQQANGFYRLSEVMNRSYGAGEVGGTSRTPGYSAVVKATGIENLEIQSMEDVILPRIHEDGVTFQYGTRFELLDQDTHESYTAFLENEKAEVIEAASHNVHATTVQAKVHERSYILNKMLDVPLSFAKFATGAGAPVVSNSLGEVDLGGSKQATITLQSDRGTIYDNTSSAAFSLSRDLTGTGSLITGNDNETRALNTFLAIQRINRFARSQVKTDEVNTYLSRDIRIKINVNGSCNAFYNPQQNQISLYAAGTSNGTSCGNMALVNDVIYHEWGHGLDSNSGKTRGINDNAFSEGIGDIVAAYYTGSSNMGAGFSTNTEKGIRDLQNTAKYPADKGEAHAEGTIIGGAFWDLRAALIQRYGEVKGGNHAAMLFFRHLITTDTYTDSYEAVKRLDDNDGNTATPSPNYCLINKAFANHGLAKDENCTDTLVQNKYPVDASLNLGIKERGSDGAVLMASTTTAAQIIGCLGERAACEQNPREDIVFEVEGQKDGKLFFVSKGKVTLSNPSWITLLGKDSAGNIIGARTMKVIER